MPELYYVTVVSQQCKDGQCVDCDGKFHAGQTADGQPIWQKCECNSCSHKFKAKSKENEDVNQRNSEV